MRELDAIVVATDFSEDAARAARRAALLADARGLPLELLHVMSAPGLDGVRAWFRERPDLAERLEADARRSLDAAAAALAAPGRAVTTRLAVGDVRAEIAAASSPSVLLVLGARGGTTLPGLLFGSTAERVVRDAAGPVLVVRSEPSHPYRNVLVGVDLERGSAPLLEAVVDFSPHARITALNAYDVPFEGGLRRAGVPQDEIERHHAATLREALASLETLGRESAPIGQRVVPTAERGAPVRLLAERAKRLGADLIAVARRSRSVLHSLLIGSVARRVVAEADCDVLVLRGPSPA